MTKDRGKENLFLIKCLFLLKSFVFKVTYVTHSLTELSKTGKVGNSFRFWLHCAFLWDHPVIVNIFSYCYCDVETQYKLNLLLTVQINRKSIICQYLSYAMVLTYLKRCLFAGSDHVLENVFGDLKA